MSSSTSSSSHARFLGWVALALVASTLAVHLVPWSGVAGSKRNHWKAALELAGDADFLMVGDSKVGPFSVDCLLPWFPGYRGLVFTADSVTPVFYYHSLSEIRRAAPEFKPRFVFIFVGANNFNANGLHVEREYTFFNELGLPDAWDLSGRQGDYLSFAEAVFSRLFPMYGKRVMITHLQIGDDTSRCSSTSPENYDRARRAPFEAVTRDPVLDRNYYDIYRRSVYASYESSPMVQRATEKLIEAVLAHGGVPLLVLPPVTPEMRKLEDLLIGDAFDETVGGIAARYGIRLLDLRDRFEYEFADVNHLSPRGARDLSIENFLPIVRVEGRTAALPGADSRAAPLP